MSEHNPWDPLDPEQAIEDPMHGPSAVHNMLQIPAMPLGDGTYYQPGAFYAQGTAHIDSQNRPVFRIGRTSTMAGMREAFELQEWVTAHKEGGDALTQLEASRQQRRLAQTSFAHCFKPSDVCPGGKRLENCEIGNAAYHAAQKWAEKNNQKNPAKEHSRIYLRVLAAPVPNVLWPARLRLKQSMACLRKVVLLSTNQKN